MILTLAIGPRLLTPVTSNVPATFAPVSVIVSIILPLAVVTTLPLATGIVQFNF